MTDVVSDCCSNCLLICCIGTEVGTSNGELSAAPEQISSLAHMAHSMKSGYYV